MLCHSRLIAVSGSKREMPMVKSSGKQSSRSSNIVTRVAPAVRSAVLNPPLPDVSDSKSESATLERPARTPWHKKEIPYFCNIDSLDHLETAIRSGSGKKFVFIDIYAGNCPACKVAMPKLGSIPKDTMLRDNFHFYKVNAQDIEIFKWVKNNQVTSLPYALVFSPDGKKLFGTTSTFKKIAAIKDGLHTILQNPQAHGFGLGPEGKIEPRG